MNTNLYISFPVASNTSRPNDSSNSCLKTEEQQRHGNAVGHPEVSSRDDENDSDQEYSDDREYADIKLEGHEVIQIAILVHIKNSKNVGRDIHERG